MTLTRTTRFFLPQPTALVAGVVAAFVSSTVLAAPKPLYQSPVLKADSAAVEISVDVTGVQKLYLVAGDAGDGFGCDWADWIEPRVTGDFGEKKLTELKWDAASAEWGQVQVGKSAGGSPLKVAGQAIAEGIGTHANSVIEFTLPAGAKKFTARAGIDEGGAKQGASTVQFMVYKEKPPVRKGGGGGGGGGKDAADELAALEVAEGLEASVFAAEPLLLSPSAIDIDAKGRVWVAEIVNYRGHNGKRPEGDRILILEDTDKDGTLDKQTVFWQTRDIDSPHGVCVLGNRVIVAAKGKVWAITDTNGDDKGDVAEVMFSGIDGAQHDHSIHAAMFGPDGKLYFNMGNEGHQLKDKDGKPVTDAAGNEVVNRRKPYQQGMVFRCDVDGSNVETVGWDFRNNWEVTVDSFGTLWQSDNDDDGNKGVRINYVMEYGNYGYADEVTGAGWQQQRSNMETEIPLRHWHLNDPGVVPNLLQTGAGSPTGIMVYEGDLLPEKYRGQIIHCDAGPNVVRAYPVTASGAGYKATVENILEGKGDKWFRPSDVLTAPDGSLVVADWYDPGVGGHAMGDLEKGRLFRVAPKGAKYSVPSVDVTTAAGAVAALKSPNNATRYLAWTALAKMGKTAEAELVKVWGGTNPRHRARALWLLGRIDGAKYVAAGIADKDADIRITGLRLARELKLNVEGTVAKLVKDPSAQVRRECALALRFSKSAEAPKLWATLAAQHDGADRWYVEALGIGAALNWDACLDAWLAQVGDSWNSPAGRDIIWRSRAKKTAGYLAKIVTDKATKPEEKPKYMRSFDFLTGPEKEKALEELLLQ